ncbi:MAG: hypothetical protein ACOYO1_04915 [Bacteroidales bacterium]
MNTIKLANIFYKFAIEESVDEKVLIESMPDNWESYYQQNTTTKESQKDVNSSYYEQSEINLKPIALDNEQLNKCNMFFRSISLNVSNEDITEWARNILINSEGFSVLDSLINWDYYLAREGIYLCKELGAYLSDEPISFTGDIIKVSSSFFIKGTNKIPNLYLYKVYQSFGKYSFIIESLQELYSKQESEIYPFINANKKKIDKIISTFGRSDFKVLGSGSDGIVFDGNNDMVLKIFKDKFSYEKAVEAYNLMHSQNIMAKTEALIYDVGILGSFLNNEIYYYIMEKMKAVSNIDNIKIQLFISLLLNTISEAVRTDKEFVNMKKNIIYSTKYSSEIHEGKEEIEEYVKKEFHREDIDAYFEKELSRMKNEINEKVNKVIIEKNKEADFNLTEIELKLRKGWLMNFIEEMILKLVSNRGDLAIRNLGVIKYKDLKFFDPAFSTLA